MGTESDDERESDHSRAVIEEDKLSKNDEWQFENKNVAKAWRKRKQKFKSKKRKSTAKSRLNRFNKMKQASHSFGGSSKRFEPKKNNSSKDKPKFVKFGCPTANQ